MSASLAVYVDSGLTAPVGIAFDTSGNLYVANINNNTISKVASDGNVSEFAFGLTGPYGLAFDTSDNLYITNIIKRFNLVARRIDEFKELTNEVGAISFRDQNKLFILREILFQ